MRPYKPHIPQNISEIWDLLGSMMISSPLFIDTSGFFAEKNIETEFFKLKESLGTVCEKLGEGRYVKLIDMADRMRAPFEADPEDKTDDSLAGAAVDRGDGRRAEASNGLDRLAPLDRHHRGIQRLQEPRAIGRRERLGAAELVAARVQIGHDRRVAMVPPIELAAHDDGDLVAQGDLADLLVYRLQKRP